MAQFIVMAAIGYALAESIGLQNKLELLRNEMHAIHLISQYIKIY